LDWWGFLSLFFLFRRLLRGKILNPSLKEVDAAHGMEAFADALAEGLCVVMGR